MLIFLVTACASNKAVFTQEETLEMSSWEPKNSVPYDSVPQIYQQWWNEISDCAKIRWQDLNRVQWFATPADTIYGINTFRVKNGFKCLIVEYCWGWWNGRHMVYILADSIYKPSLVKHEMLHDLLGSRNLKRKDNVHHKLFKKCKVE